ncbi:hypothetical protein D3C80_1748640 [compost metagenome]
MIQRDTRRKPTTFTDFTPRADKAVRAYSDTGCNTRRTFNDRKGADARRRINHRIRRNHR